MSTHLSRHFEQARLARGLKPGQVAQLCDSSNVSKVGNRIRVFELSGNVSKELFGKLVAFFEINAETIEKLAEQDRREFFDQWLAWVNEPITPHLVIRVMAAIYTTRAVQKEIATMEAAESWASGVAREIKKRCCLVWSRRISIWFGEDGSVIERTEAVPGEPNCPWIKIGSRTFMFGEDLRSVAPVTWPKKPGE
ncbi:MAG: hypothetical protein HYX68_14170 [Planctomycetes bacterium]|nr:hypothetical protein [Planctomycetota bacterium]